MIYDLIIIGAGAAGLFAGASLPSPVRGLVLEKKPSPGRKLLLTGDRQCNLTHGGSIKDFITHYGRNGSRVRSCLYRFNNLAVADFFESRGLPLLEREDGKIFPRSLRAQDVLDVLITCCVENGLDFRYSSAVDRIGVRGEGPLYTVYCGKHSYETKKLIVATGGCSYPATGSDGSFLSVLENMGLEICPPAPALVPIYPEQYPYQGLSGISFQDALVTVSHTQSRDALLLTHTCFSGPAVLNLSRHAHAGDTVTVNYYPTKPEETILRELSQAVTGSGKQLLTVLYEYSGLPKRFLEVLCRRAGTDGAEKASRISPAELKALIRLIARDEYKIQRMGGYEAAMVTRGGVALSEVDSKTMESLKYPSLFFAGEVLDADAYTGGFNLQIAFSTGRLAGLSV
ncbi:MAG TPA: aminoacetone oxidase family FAD-binding enzyme [Bacillota bacterium]|nr:aminoacetone oxidase family FAD-binding enzyme [Bacillota bacterium]